MRPTWRLERYPYMPNELEMPFSAMRKKNCWMIGRTRVTVLYRTRVTVLYRTLVPCGVGIMFIEDAEIGFRRASVAFGSLVFRDLAAAVPLSEPYMEPAAPTSICMFERI